MSYTEPLFNQISRFLMSMGFGFVLCIIYLIFSFLRMLCGEKRWMYILYDTLFGITATVLSFFFMLIYNNGQVRLNLVVGQLIGGAVLYFTLGRRLIKPMTALSKLVRGVLKIVLMPLKLYIESFPAFFRRLRDRMSERKKRRSALKKENTEGIKGGRNRKKRKNKKEIKKYSENTLEKSA